MGIFAAIGALTALFFMFLISTYLEGTVENRTMDFVNGILKGFFKK